MKNKQLNFEKFHSQLDLPFLETNNECIKEILQTLKLKFGLKSNSKQKFIDLGAGNGSVVIFTALNYNIESYGIEIDQTLVKEAEFLIKSIKKEGKYNKSLFKKIKIRLGNFYMINLEAFDFIYIYSLPSMHKFLKHVFSTAKNSAVIISHKYPFKKFNSILKDEYRLTHIKDKKEINSYFYLKNP